jgi:hypothetical protein
VHYYSKHWKIRKDLTFFWWNFHEFNMNNRWIVWISTGSVSKKKAYFFSLKGTVSRDFRPLVFFHQTIPSGPLIHGLKPFRIRLRIREVIRQSRCLSGVNDTAKASLGVSLTSLNPPERCQRHSKSSMNGVNYTTEAAWVVSMTPLRTPERCQWHRWGDITPLRSGT